MKKSVLSPFVTLGAVFGLVVAMLMGGTAVFGQATPAGQEGDGPVHPAHIHAGMCPEVGDVVFPLENVVQVGQGVDNEGTSEVGMGTPMADLGTADVMSSPTTDASMTGTPIAANMAMTLESTTVVEASLEDIVGGEHAINVHQSPEELSVYIACGNVTGEIEDDQLVIDLEELNDSGVSGNATLTDNGDGTTTVLLELRHMDNMNGTPEATPGS
jgi:hypothetical protein